MWDTVAYCNLSYNKKQAFSRNRMASIHYDYPSTKLFYMRKVFAPRRTMYMYLYLHQQISGGSIRSCTSSLFKLFAICIIFVNPEFFSTAAVTFFSNFFSVIPRILNDYSNSYISSSKFDGKSTVSDFCTVAGKVFKWALINVKFCVNSSRLT